MRCASSGHACRRSRQGRRGIGRLAILLSFKEGAATCFIVITYGTSLANDAPPDHSGMRRVMAIASHIVILPESQKLGARSYSFLLEPRTLQMLNYPGLVGRR